MCHHTLMAQYADEKAKSSRLSFTSDETRCFNKTNTGLQIGGSIVSGQPPPSVRWCTARQQAERAAERFVK
ncbi:hypothetical protein EVAR_37662_1 [Eumeta japonica]|uniref:Uncharacterized protein n=1 Tax=Eumeta variegata TaxID=151549 RepID=A0A4C1YWS3_EUMVA|nr:hypothetical protein EVAR_37662_1 [Eumeta japonica]